MIELPFGVGKPYLNRSGVADQVLGGWQFTGMVSAQTGQFFDVTWTKQDKFFGTRQGERRADVVGDWRPVQQTPGQWYVPGAFAKPYYPDDKNWANCSQGNLGRNALQEAGIFNWDFGLGKT